MRRSEIIIPVVLAVLILAGLVLSSSTSVYRYDISFEVDRDDVRYTVSSDVGMETTTVVISNSGQYSIEYVAAYFDEGYAALNSWELQEEMFEDMEELLSLRSIDGFGLHDSESLLELMSTRDPSTTAIFIASGSISDILYDGTADSPLVEWLRSGGIIINMAGCLGAYVSHGPEQEDIEHVIGYGEIFAGVPDLCFNDSDSVVYANEGYNEEVRDALHFYMNECTYGVDLWWMQDCLNIGYYSYSGCSAAALYKSGEGMVMNFGVSLSTHEHSDHYIAQIIASGMDYTSEILECEQGDTRGDSTGVVHTEGSCRVYCFIGSTRAVHGEFIDIAP